MVWEKPRDRCLTKRKYRTVSLLGSIPSTPSPRISKLRKGQGYPDLRQDVSIDSAIVKLMGSYNWGKPESELANDLLSTGSDRKVPESFAKNSARGV